MLKTPLAAQGLGRQVLVKLSTFRVLFVPY